MIKCCVCNNEVDSENAPILTMGGFGNPKYLCAECEKNIEKATASRSPEEIEEGCRNLGEALTEGNTDDISVIDTVNSILSDAAERCAAIKAGTYDFSLDEEKAEDEDDAEEFELTEELMESEEDRLKDEHDAEVAKKIDNITSWIAGIIMLAAVVFFIIYFLF